jgi:uncharacterized membrane protein
MPLPLSAIDWSALTWFITWWVGYVFFAAWHARRVPGLVTQMTHLRRDWVTALLARDNRIGDVSILANLSNGSTFFASTTLLILGGLLALLGTTEKVASVMAELPFTKAGPERLWDIKILLLVAIFTFAFFKFTWSLRLYHFCSVMVGGAPAPDASADAHGLFVERATRTTTLAAESFNNGLRAYYFALAALTWFLNSWVWMIATSWVVLVLYHREFRSHALAVLRQVP